MGSKTAQTHFNKLIKEYRDNPSQDNKRILAGFVRNAIALGTEVQITGKDWFTLQTVMKGE